MPGVVVAVVVLIASGCGGGSGGDGGGRPVTPATTMRAMTPGLNYSYNFTGRIISDNRTTLFSGTSTTSLAHGSFNGQTTVNGFPVLVSTTSAVITALGEQTTLTYRGYGYQNASGDLFSIGDGDSGGTVAYTPHLLTRPGRHDAFTGLAQEVAASDGTTLAYSLTTQRAERVTVPAGTFDCWKVATTETTPTQTITATYWYAPQIGYWVRREAVTTDHEEEVTLRGTLELTETNAL